MEIFSKHFVIFLYIISFLMGISAITAISFIASKEKSQTYNSLRKVITIFLLIDLTNFLQFYKEFFFTQWEMNLGIMFLFDISSVAFSYYWLNHTSLLNDEKLSKKDGTIILFSGSLYIIAWGSTYIFNMDKNYQIQNFSAQIFTLLAEIIFYVVFILMTSINIYKYIHNSRIQYEKKYYMLLGILFLSYFIWLLCWDIRLVFPPSKLMPLGSGAFDFVIICCYIIYGSSFMYFHHITKNKGLNLETENLADMKKMNFTLANLAEIYHLSNREIELAELVLRGFSNPDISSELSISNNTVKRHMNNIYRKINIKSRFELICLMKKD